MKVRDAEVHRVRARIEKVVGATKRSHGLGRRRWLAPTKAGLQVCLAAMAYNPHRCFRVLAGAPMQIQGASVRTGPSYRRRTGQTR